MIFHPAALAALIAHCAPNVAAATMTAIIKVESGGNPLAISDNTAGRSYYPRELARAESLARRLLQAGHSIDAGIAQIDSMNFAGFGATVRTIFDPCVNLSIGARILTDDYAFAARRYRDAQTALRHAIGMYNTGRPNAGERYVARVLDAAGIRDNSTPSARVVPTRDAIGPMPPERRKPHGTRRVRVTPARAPILVSNVSHVVVF